MVVSCTWNNFCFSERRSELYDQDNPDWVPTVNMGFKQLSTPDVANGRYQRRIDRSRKADAAQTLLSFSQLVEADGDEENITPQEDGTASQTDMTSKTIDSMQNEINYLQDQNEDLKQQLRRDSPYSMESLRDNDEKVKYFTGLPGFSVLFTLFNYLEEYLTARNSMTKFESLVLVLVKLRLNLSNQFLAYEFNLTAATISRIFSSVVEVMFIRMKPFVFWPDRETLRMTTPMQFRKHFGTRCAAIIDCFEVFIERPSNIRARAETWSSYKHHNTVKFLLGITPQGVICFLSRSWGGRSSDKHITENCGFLDKILPGDLILADRGFDIQDSVGSVCAEVKIPAFTKGKSQLSPIDIETTRKLANVRIHVERVIGLVRQKYTILSSTLPIDMLLTRNPDEIPTIDKITLICCALVNLCESVVVFD